MVKTRILSAVLAVCMLLAGCSGGNKNSAAAAKKTAENLENPFESNLNIKLGDMEAQALFVREAPGSCTLTMLSPESMKGTEVVFTEDKVNISYMGLSMKVDPATVPGSAAIKLLVGALDTSLQEEGVRLSYDDQVLTATGDVGTGKFTFKIDPKTGNLLNLSIPDEELEIEFKNFKLLS